MKTTIRLNVQITIPHNLEEFGIDKEQMIDDLLSCARKTVRKHVPHEEMDGSQLCLSAQYAQNQLSVVKAHWNTHEPTLFESI